MTTTDAYADTAGRAVLETIRNYGVSAVFGIPGTHNLEFYRPLAELGFRVVTNRHEQGSGYGADGWSQQTGLPGVVITTSGPGNGSANPASLTVNATQTRTTNSTTLQQGANKKGNTYTAASQSLASAVCSIPAG